LKEETRPNFGLPFAWDDVPMWRFAITNWKRVEVSVSTDDIMDTPISVVSRFTKENTIEFEPMVYTLQILSTEGMIKR
jgi:hypothetical protein